MPARPLKPAGGAARIDLTGEFYVGIGVSAHNPGRIETATFSDVTIGTPAAATGNTTLINTLETISLRSKDRRVVYVTTQPGRIEAPNWYPDGTNTLYFNNGGKLFKVQADPPGAPRNPSRQATPEPVDLGILTRINNDHGITADGKVWAISDQSQTVERPASVAHLRRAVRDYRRRNGSPSRGPSYFHGWSPDGRTLTYCAQRNGNFDVYTVPADGGPETRLTTAEGKDDGPEYSPDGKQIYFNSERTGAMQIWRMNAGRHEPGAGHERRRGELVPARLAGRRVAGLPGLREGGRRSPREQGRDAAS